MTDGLHPLKKRQFIQRFPDRFKRGNLDILMCKTFDRMALFSKSPRNVMAKLAISSNHCYFHGRAPTGFAANFGRSLSSRLLNTWML